MFLILLWLFSFLFFTCIGLLFFNELFKNKMVMQRRVAPFVTPLTVPNQLEQDHIKNKSLYIRLIKPLLLKIRQMTVGKMPKQKMAMLEKKLQAAGYPFGLSVGDFILVQFLLPTSVSIFFALIFLPTTDEHAKVVILIFIVGMFVHFYTNYYLIAKSKQRAKLIDKAMPDFFDMLNVSIEAGMGLDGALKKVCSQLDTPLSKEFLSSLEDMKLGKSRKQAFMELRERVPSEFFRSVMSSLIQADQMGLGISKVLRIQSQRIREKQRLRAKEQAMKAPVKMLIPMVLFIFPTLFIVLLGPIVIQIVTEWL